VVFFRQSFKSGLVLNTTDDNLGVMVAMHHSLEHGFKGYWSDIVLLGNPAKIAEPSFRNIALKYLSPDFVINFLHVFYLCVGSVFFARFLRNLGLGMAATLMGVLTGFWCGTNLTLVAAGHIGKYEAMMFASIALWSIHKTAITKSFLWAIVAGGSVGAMFLGQADVALFIGLFLGGYAVFSWIHASHKLLPEGLYRLAVMGVVAACMAGPSVLATYSVNVDGVTVTDKSFTSNEQLYKFATQWSTPPEEILEFVAPGYFGWRSGYTKGPYIGRTGQDPDYQPGSGRLRNLRTETLYMGSIPVFFALLACLLAWSKEPGELVGSNRSLLKFWSVAMLIALLLAFGRFFPLYKLFFMIPGISSIRNPNKFMHIFQMAFAILAAYGFHVTFAQNTADRIHDKLRKIMFGFMCVIASIATLLFLSWILASLPSEGAQAQFAKEWGGYAKVILDNRSASLIHGAMLLLIPLSALFLVVKGKLGDKKGLYVSMAIVLIVMGDMLRTSSHFIEYTPKADLYGQNDLIDFLSESLGNDRAAVFPGQFNQPQQAWAPYYQQWMSVYGLLKTYSFPYHRIPVMNITAMPRMAEELKMYLGLGSANPLPLWKASAVEYAVIPTPLVQSFMSMPNVSAELSPVFGILINGGGLQSLQKVPLNQSSHFVVFKVLQSVNRFNVYSRWSFSETEEAALRSLADPSFAFQSMALVHGQATMAPPDYPAPQGTVELIDSIPGKSSVKVSIQSQSLVTFVERYTPDWTVTVDGAPADLQRVNMLSMGVFVPPGDHEIVFEYLPSNKHLILQVGVIFLSLGACGLGLFREMTLKGDK
jgi:hypothetical protein